MFKSEGTTNVNTIARWIHEVHKQGHFLTTNTITIKGLESKGVEKMVPRNSILSGCKSNIVM